MFFSIGDDSAIPALLIIESGKPIKSHVLLKRFKAPFGDDKSSLTI